MERTKILCLLADVSNYRQYFISLFSRYDFHVDYKNQNMIGLSHEKLGKFDLIFRNVKSKNDDLYKYAKNNIKTFCCNGYFTNSSDITLLNKDDDGYFVRCFEGGNEYRLDVFVMNRAADDLIKYLFSDNKSIYYIANFKQGLFDGTFQKLSFAVKPTDVEGYETKELAFEAALKNMQNTLAQYCKKKASYEKIIKDYEFYIRMYTREIKSIEELISKFENALTQYENSSSVD